MRSLASTRPASKTGQVIWAWAEIEACLASGMNLKEVWEAACKDGLDSSYAQFRVYISRIRRRRQRSAEIAPQPPAARINDGSSLTAPLPSDPFLNLRLEREKKERSGFEYDPFSINKNLI